MNRILVSVLALGLAGSAQAQLWDGSALPPAFPSTPTVDSYFADGGALSEFDTDVGIEFSLQEYGTKPVGINTSNGWSDASNFATMLQDGDNVTVTYLGKTAGWKNDFGLNLDGMNAYGPDAYTLWNSITNGSPAVGSQYSFSVDNGFKSDLGVATPMMLDFWLNSNNATYGGTYSIFYPASSVPSNSGLPNFDYSALGKVFNVNDSFTGENRSILVIALEDWRNFDRDFSDIFFAIEITDRDGTPQFPVPEPSTYGLIGAMVLLGLVAVRRSRR